MASRALVSPLQFPVPVDFGYVTLSLHKNMRVIAHAESICTGLLEITCFRSAVHHVDGAEDAAHSAHRRRRLRPPSRPEAQAEVAYYALRLLPSCVYYLGRAKKGTKRPQGGVRAGVRGARADPAVGVVRHPHCAAAAAPLAQRAGEQEEAGDGAGGGGP